MAGLNIVHVKAFSTILANSTYTWLHLCLGTCYILNIANDTCKSCWTHTLEISSSLSTCATIFTRPSLAPINYGFTMLSRVARFTVAAVRSYFIHTSGSILTGLRKTLVYMMFTPPPRESLRACTCKIINSIMTC